MNLLVATTNPHKVREIRPLLADCGVTVQTLDDLPPIVEPDESAATYWENAREKALAYGRATDWMVVAEDSGLEITALDRAPGVRSARFLGHGASYSERFAEIYRRLATHPPAHRHARFVTALAAVRGGTILFETEAWIDGEVAMAPTGDRGFGYDPIFLYPPLRRTTGELTLEEKGGVSHRARAFRDFAGWLKQFEHR